MQYIPADIPVVLDFKRGDIGTTAEAYAAAAYEELGAEAVTINAYMGTDTVAPVSSLRLLFVWSDCLHLSAD